MSCILCGVGGCGVGTRSRMCHGGWGGGTWGKCCYVYMRTVKGRLWYPILCVDHLCTLYTYLICMYWAIIYKDMGTAVFCSRTLTRK
jgi:hypothetical protein